MILAGQGGQCRGYLGKARPDVGCHSLSAAAVIFVAGVGLGDRIAEVAFYPGQGGVPDPVHAHLLGGDPRQMLAKAPPEVVVAPRADWLSVRVSQHMSTWSKTSPDFDVGKEMRHQRGGYRLPAHSLAFLVELDEAVLGIEVF